MTKRSDEDKVFINHLKTALFWINESMDVLESPNPRRGGLCNSSCRPSDEFSCCFYEAYTTGIIRGVDWSLAQQASFSVPLFRIFLCVHIDYTSMSAFTISVKLHLTSATRCLCMRS